MIVGILKFIGLAVVGFILLILLTFILDILEATFKK